MVEGEGFKFAPSTQGVAKSALSIVDHFVAMMNTIPRIEGEIGKGAGGSGGSRLLTVGGPDEEFVVNARSRLQEIVEMNMELSGQLVSAYKPFAYLLSADTDKKIDEFNKGKHTLQATPPCTPLFTPSLHALSSHLRRSSPPRSPSTRRR